MSESIRLGLTPGSLGLATLASKGEVTANELLQRPAAEALAWAEAVWAGTEPCPSDFNWQGLAEVVADLAHSVGEPVDLTWAELAVRTYDWLAARTKHPDSFKQSAMMLRATCISQLGSVPGHSVLDLERLLFWWQTRLDRTLAEAQWQAKQRRREDLLPLRRLKNRLVVLEALFSSGKVATPPDIVPWLALRPQLP